MRRQAAEDAAREAREAAQAAAAQAVAAQAALDAALPNTPNKRKTKTPVKFVPPDPFLCDILTPNGKHQMFPDAPPNVTVSMEEVDCTAPPGQHQEEEDPPSHFQEEEDPPGEYEEEAPPQEEGVNVGASGSGVNTRKRYP